MTKVTERTESRVRQFLSEFKLFTGNIQLLFKQNIKEVMLFNLFCSIITVVVTTTMKNLLMRAFVLINSLHQLYQTNHGAIIKKLLIMALFWLMVKQLKVNIRLD